MVRLLLALSLVAATVVAYAPLLDNGFVNYDDDLYVTNSHQVRLGLTRESVSWAFSSFHGANWFPLTRLSWMLDSELFGMDPVGFHATSLALHAAAAAVLFLALHAMSGALYCSAFVAGVFALHPLHVESVAWAAARKDVLSGLFFAAVLWAWALYARTDDRASARRYYAAAVVSLCLGLLAKQMLVTLPFLLLLLDEWPLGRLRAADGRLEEPRVRRALLEKAPLLAVVAVASGVVVLAQRSGGTVQTFEVFPLGIRIENALLSVGAYARQSFWPVGLSVFYPHPGYTLSGSTVAAAAAFLVAVSSAALWLLRRWPPLAVGWFWFLGTLVPVIGLVQIGQAARADRYTYLPLIGLTIPVAWGLAAVAARGRAARGLAATGAVAVLLALAASTWFQVQVWRDSSSLFRHALAVTSDNHVAHMNLGLDLMQAGRLEDASRHLGVAVRLAPGSPMAQGLLGELRSAQGRWREAADHFREALRGKRDTARWNAGLGRALLELGRIDESVARLEKAVAQRPDSVAIRETLAAALARRGETEAAIEQLAEARRLDPGSARIRAHLGDSQTAHARQLASSGRDREAVAVYREALANAARSPGLLNNLAWLLATSEDSGIFSPAEAVALAEEAAAVSGSAEILDTLSIAYAAAGRHEEAADAARRALARAEQRGDVALAEQIRRRRERTPEPAR